MRLLELFAGTGSVGRAFRELGWEVVSLDIEPGHTIQADVLTWDYRTYPPGYFDCVHASPPCTE
jgi:site-specific DNA-cytosine methylase